MSDFEFNIKENTLEELIRQKNQAGYGEKTWDEWFASLFSQDKDKRSDLEQVFEKLHYDKNYVEWVKSFALKLNDVWNEPSARQLTPANSDIVKERSAIIVGAGPSVKKHDHLKLLAESDYNGSIICTDRMLLPTLKAGITPDRFAKFYVITIDGAEILKKFYDDELLKKYVNKINGIFSTIVHPSTVHNDSNLKKPEAIARTEYEREDKKEREKDKSKYSDDERKKAQERNDK